MFQTRKPRQRRQIGHVRPPPVSDGFALDVTVGSSAPAWRTPTDASLETGHVKHLPCLILLCPHGSRMREMRLGFPYAEENWFQRSQVTRPRSQSSYECWNEGPKPGAQGPGAPPSASTLLLWELLVASEPARMGRAAVGATSPDPKHPFFCTKQKMRQSCFSPIKLSK